MNISMSLQWFNKTSTMLAESLSFAFAPNNVCVKLRYRCHQPTYFTGGQRDMVHGQAGNTDQADRSWRWRVPGPACCVVRRRACWSRSLLAVHVVCSLACFVGWREQHAADCIARRADSDADDIGVPVGQPAAVPAAANRRESLWHVIQPRQQLVQHELHLVLPISGWGREQPVPL